MTAALPPSPIIEIASRKLIFVSGKGGVGKTVVSQALALALSRNFRTLWVTFEDPLRPAGELRKINPTLEHLNCDASVAFEEYMGMKIGIPALTRVFLQNKLIRFLAKAAPGIHELVLLGKVWHDRTAYDRVVVDMPSTGYGLAMFQSTDNFAQLFKTGPLYKDAVRMLETFRDPAECGQVIVGLPEEMPLRESLELDAYLQALFPANRAGFIVNKRFPRVTTDEEERSENPDSWPSPYASDGLDYARKRSVLEAQNLRLWSEAGIRFSELEHVPPRSGQSFEGIVSAVSAQMREKGMLP